MEKKIFPYADKIIIHPSFIFLFPLLAIIDENSLVFYTFWAVITHEFGHILAIIYFGACIEEIHIRISGIEIKLEKTASLSYLKEIIIRICGPAAGFIAALIFSPLGYLTGGNSNFFLLAGANFILSAINLLPLNISDGGLILYYILACKINPVTAERVTGIISSTIGMIVVLCGIWVLFATRGNITLCLFGSYLLIRKKEY